LHDGSADSRTRLAIEAIAGYLARWPDAADTEQGIARWWLPRMGVELPLADVRSALDRLVQSKAMARTSLPEGSVIYRAAEPAPRPH